MPMVVRATLICWALVWGISGEETQRLTVPEALAAAGESLVAGSSVPSGPAPSLTEILAETDLVVRGSIGAGRSYLSDDQRDVLTEWVIDNPVVIYQRDPAIPSRPAPAAPLTVVQKGGSFRIGELTYTEVHGALPPLESKTACLLLLNEVNGKYYLAGTFYGAFDVGEGRMVPLSQKDGFADELRDRPVAEGVATIVEQIRRTPGL